MQAAQAGELDTIKHRGTLIVGVKADYPPFGYRAPDGSIVGIEPSLAAGDYEMSPQQWQEIAALTPPEHEVEIIYDEKGPINYDDPADIVGMTGMAFKPLPIDAVPGSDLIKLTPYIDFNVIDGAGWGFHLGALMTLSLSAGFNLTIAAAPSADLHRQTRDKRGHVRTRGQRQREHDCGRTDIFSPAIPLR